MNIRADVGSKIPCPQAGRLVTDDQVNACSITSPVGVPRSDYQRYHISLPNHNILELLAGGTASIQLAGGKLVSHDTLLNGDCPTLAITALGMGINRRGIYMYESVDRTLPPDRNRMGSPGVHKDSMRAHVTRNAKLGT